MSAAQAGSARYQAWPVSQCGHFTVVDTGARNTNPHSQL